MTIPIQFTNLTNEVSEPLEAFTQEKFERIFKMIPNITSIHVTFNVMKLSHIAEADLHIPKFTVHAKAESADMYQTIGELVDKLATQLKKHKDKTADHHS